MYQELRFLTKYIYTWAEDEQKKLTVQPSITDRVLGFNMRHCTKDLNKEQSKWLFILERLALIIWMHENFVRIGLHVCFTRLSLMLIIKYNI